MDQEILAIEDDRDALANLRDILELDGDHVTGAATLKEAAAAGNWSAFSVILLDRRLPDGTADSVLPHIHSAGPGGGDCHHRVRRFGGDDRGPSVRGCRLLAQTNQPGPFAGAVARVLKMREMEERALQAERLAAVGQMISVLTHESGNALARCQVLLATLADEVATDLTPSRRRSITSRPSRPTPPLRGGPELRRADQPRPYPVGPLRDLAPSVGKRVGGFEPPIRSALREQTAGMNLECDVDSFRIDQVFRNLFENALAASPEPPGSKSLARKRKSPAGPAVRICIRDNGPGLTAAHRTRVFNPFFTTKRKGSGLGLAIAKRIIEAHGGEIGIGPNGPGAEFFFTLPRTTCGRRSRCRTPSIALGQPANGSYGSEYNESAGTARSTSLTDVSPVAAFIKPETPIGCIPSATAAS